MGGDLQLVYFAIAIAVLVWAKHHTNIRRLLAGEEPKIGQGK
jgi:glycerol-3-phosphate acyltransferase PlsY